MKWTCGIVHLVSSFVKMGIEKFQSDKKKPYLRSTDKGDMPHTFFFVIRLHSYFNMQAISYI